MENMEKTESKKKMWLVIAYVTHVFVIIGTILYALHIIQYFMENKGDMDVLGMVLTSIHVFCSVLVVLPLFLSLTNNKKIWKVTGICFAAAIFTGMRYYFLFSFFPPLWRSLLLLIPALLFLGAISIRDPKYNFMN